MFIPALAPTLEAVTLAAEAVTLAAVVNTAEKAAAKTYQAGKVTRQLTDKYLIPAADGFSWLIAQIDWSEVKEGLIQAVVITAVAFYTLGQKTRILWSKIERSLVYRSPAVKVITEPEEKVIPQPIQKVNFSPAQKLLPPAAEKVIDRPAQKVNSRPAKKPLTSAQLKNKCKVANLKGYSKLNKSQLISLLEENNIL
jgi:hypothetical protein